MKFLVLKTWLYEKVYIASKSFVSSHPKNSCFEICLPACIFLSRFSQPLEYIFIMLKNVLLHFFLMLKVKGKNKVFVFLSVFFYSIETKEVMPY